MTPTEVAEALAERFDLVVSRQTVAHYDAGSNSSLPMKWRAIHEAARQAFIADLDGIAISHRSYRLREIEGVLRRAKASRNSVLVLAALKEAREEVAPRGSLNLNLDLASCSDAEIGRLAKGEDPRRVLRDRGAGQ